MPDQEPPYGPPTVAPPPYPPGPQGPPPRSRRPVLIALVAAVVVIALAVGVPVLVQRLGRTEPQVAANLHAVRVYTDLLRDHTQDDVDYPVSPPVGGPHDPVWLACGLYDAPVRDEMAVHDLEHGTVWISYRSGLGDSDVAELRKQLPDNGILAPYDDLPAPVVITVWGAQLRLAGADDPRIPLFVERFGDGHTAPEPFASCEGGVRDSGGSGTSV